MIPEGIEDHMKKKQTKKTGEAELKQQKAI